jgi:uncharacterized protein YciI
MKRIVLLVVVAVALLVIGYIAGIYTLPILTAPKPASAAEIQSLAQAATFSGVFRRDLEGSDALHWGEGTVSINPRAISLAGKVAPGPDYKLYLAPEFVDTEEAFLQVKARAVRVADVKTFENFVVAVPETVNVGEFTTVVVWCEAFSQFITAAEYRKATGETAAKPAPVPTFLVVYTAGPNFRVGRPLKEQDLKAHGPYMLGLYEQGTLIEAGGFRDDSGGAVLFRAADAAAAKSIVENDPAVRAGIFVYQLHPWHLVDWEQRLKKSKSSG